MVAGPDLPELAATVGEIQSSGERGLAALCDVTLEDNVAAVVDQARAEFGRIDILVNNAGIAGPTAPVEKVAREDWDQVLAVNLTGAFLCAKHVAPIMRDQGRGKIINISSIAGKIGYPLRGPYAASKWGIIGLTLTLAKELGSHGVQVNAVCPGPVEGPRMDAVFEARARETGRKVEEVRREYQQATSLGRLVQPDDVAALTAYLASAHADNITGQAFDVTAGYGL
jgi:NAD(P)-dependent dehydrogenase (short-subunit alcohol dehydrogenase family)